MDWKSTIVVDRKSMQWKRTAQNMMFSVWYTTPNANNHVEVGNIKCKLKHYILTMVICGSYMFKFSVNKDMSKRVTMIEGQFQHIL